MNSFKLALPAATVAIAMALVACISPDNSASEPVQAEVDTDGLTPKGCPPGVDCRPPKTTSRGGLLAPVGDLVVSPPPPPPPPPSRDLLAQVGPLAAVDTGAPWETGGLPISCEGPSPTVPGAWLVPIGGQCWSVVPTQVDGGIGSGYTRISLYLCPPSMPISHCNSTGSCWCYYY